MGEVAWVGRGSLGRDDGRVVLLRPGRELLRPVGPPDGVERPAGEVHERLRAHLRRRGACFYRELFGASGARSDREALDALWDLVWAGEVTNDTFAPLRALRWKRPAKDHRPRPGRLTALGPPEAAGRWSLVDDEDGRGHRDDAHGAHPRPGPRPARAPRRAHARGRGRRGRRGWFLRRLPGPPRARGGGADPPRVLRRRPRRGAVRAPGRGRPAARAARPARRDGRRARRVVHLLAAADPANPYGAAIPWPRRDEADRRPLQRAAGAYVAMVDGAAVLYLDRGGTSHPGAPGRRGPRGLGARPPLARGPRCRRTRRGSW